MAGEVSAATEFAHYAESLVCGSKPKINQNQTEGIFHFPSRFISIIPDFNLDCLKG